MCKLAGTPTTLQWKQMRMGQYLRSFPSPKTYPRPRRQFARRRRHPVHRLDPTFVIQPGGMVELALREMGAVLVRVLPPEI